MTKREMSAQIEQLNHNVEVLKTMVNHLGVALRKTTGYYIENTDNCSSRWVKGFNLWDLELCRDDQEDEETRNDLSEISDSLADKHDRLKKVERAIKFAGLVEKEKEAPTGSCWGGSWLGYGIADLVLSPYDDYRPNNIVNKVDKIVEHLGLDFSVKSSEDAKLELKPKAKRKYKKRKTKK